MFKVLFVCSGNICRSPSAEGVFAHKACMRGLEGQIAWDSAGTHGFHAGSAPDLRSTQVAKSRGYDLSGQKARQVIYGDFEDFDLILCMDKGHYETLMRAAPLQYQPKIRMFDVRDVPDPYYGGEDGFERVLDQIEEATERWLELILEGKAV